MKSNDFTTGKIAGPLISFALPVLLALFLQSLYGAVDMIVIGKFGDAADITAVSTGSQVMNVLTMVISGLSMGSTILLGQKLGEGRKDVAGEVIGSSILLFFAMSLIMTAITVIGADPLSAMMRVKPEAVAKCDTYIRICGAGSVFIVAYNVLGSIFRGIGNSRMPLVTVTIATVINIIGDLLLVGGFGMGVAGAAIATVAAQAVSVLLSIVIIARSGLPFEFNRSKLHFNKEHIKNVISLGSPIALVDLLVSVSFLVITAIVNSIGVVEAAGVGVAERICGFIMLVPSAFNQSMSAFVSQNVGARQYKRADRALATGIGISFIAGVAMFYISFFHGDMLAYLFAEDNQIIAFAFEYLRSYSIDCLLTCFLFCFLGYFNGWGKTRFVMVQGLIAAFFVRIPIAYLMSKRVPVSLFLIGLATPSSTVVQIILCFIYLTMLKKKIGKDELK